MEVNKHINFLKRRGFLIKESSIISEDQLGMFPNDEMENITVEPKNAVPTKNVKTSPTTNIQPSNTPEFDLRDDENNPLTDDLGFATMCTEVGGEFCQLDKILVDLISDKDHKLAKALKESTTKIYKKLLPPKGKNLSRFNRLVGVILRQNPDSAINTFVLIADGLETINTNELVSLRKVLKSKDINDIDDDMVLGLIDSIKYKSYTEYENSFVGDHFKAFKTRLEIDFKGELILNKKLADELVFSMKNNVDYRDLSHRLYNNIMSNFSKGVGKFIKADLQCIKTLYNDKNEPIIKGPTDGSRGEYVEVKKMDYNLDSYLSEFFGIYKTPKTLPTELKNFKEKGDKGLILYNKVIDDLYLKLKTNDGGILEKVYNSFAGIMYEENRFIPREHIKLYWSNRGQRLNDHRLSLRFRVVSDKVEGYIYDINSDTLRTEDDLDIKIHDKEWNIKSDLVTEASVTDRDGKEWDRDSTQGKMIRTQGGTKELDTDFDWVSDHMESLPDDPKILALIKHLGSSEVIGEDFDGDAGGWYGNHTVMKIQNGEEWVVGDETSMGNALYEYFDNYIDDVGLEELGMDLSDYVTVSDHWIEGFCSDEADNSIDDMSDEEILDTYDDYDLMADIEELAEKAEDMKKEYDELSDTLAGLTQTLQRMESENQDYTQYGYSEPPHDEETMDNAREYVEERVGRFTELEEEIEYDLVEEKDELVQKLREDVKQDSIYDCERCMQDPVDCIVNEKGWYRTGGEAIDAFGWDIDRERLINNMMQDGYGSMSHYDGTSYEEDIDGHTYILIRVN